MIPGTVLIWPWAQTGCQVAATPHVSAATVLRHHQVICQEFMSSVWVYKKMNKVVTVDRIWREQQWKKMAFSDIDAHSNTHSIHLSDHNPEDQRLDCILGIVWIKWMACAPCALQVCPTPKTNWRTIFVKVIDGALTATEESHSVTFAHCPSAPLDIPHLDSQTCCEHPM